MQEQCIVSVIMPAYNCKKTICQAIDSVLIQNVPLELLVIDDGSAEPLDDIMRQYQTDKRVIFLKNERNMGVAAARNRGIGMAKGEYIAFLDADDYWVADKLSKQLDCIRKENVVLCATGRELMSQDGTLTGRVISVKEHITYDDMLKQNWINNSSVLVLRQVLLEFPQEADDAHEDYLLWLKVLSKYKRAYAINEPMLKYRVDHGSKSGNKWKSAVMTYKTYRKAGLSMPKAIKSFICYAFAGVKKYYT